MWQLNLLLSLAVSLVLWPETRSFTVFFVPGIDYFFSYTGESILDGVGTFLVDSQIRVTQLDQPDNDTQHCLFTVDNFHIRVQHGDDDQYAYLGAVNFDEWLSFTMDRNGHIKGVFYDVNLSDLDALQLKKNILSVLSNKLMVSEIAEDERHQWAYESLENSHKGPQAAKYQAKPIPEENAIIFNKQPRVNDTDDSNSVDHTYSKTISLDRSLKIPKRIEIIDKFKIDDKNRRKKRSGNTINSEDLDPRYEFPDMAGNGKVVLTYDRQSPSSNIQSQKMPSNMTSDSLEYREKPLKMFNSSESLEYFNGNLTCLLQTEENRENESKMNCFTMFKTTIIMTPFMDLEARVAEYYNTSKEWTMIINGLGAARTNDSLSLLAQYVLASDEQIFNNTMMALAQLISLPNCPPKVIPRTLLRRVMYDPWIYEDEDETKQVNDRALLVLGSLSRTMQHCNSTWTEYVTRYIQSVAEMHDPYRHRKRRELMSKQDFKHYVTKKAVQIMALSNGRHPESYSYLLSYVNDSDSHIHLRCSAVRGISRYETLMAAEVLLSSALTDPDETVRERAIEAYSLHPHGGDIRYMLVSGQYKYSNITDPEHVRVRRSLANVASRIWKGFHFTLRTPPFNWQKSVGGSQLGASIGVMFNNLLAIEIGPLSGAVEVNIQDRAWASVHLGIIGRDFHIFLADLCYKGSIGYELNLLSEYQRDAVDRTAALIDRVINRVVRTIKDAINNFKDLVSLVRNFDIGDIIRDFIQALREMPRKVFNLKKVTRMVQDVIDEYDTLPPVFELIKDFVKKVKRIYSDVKSDIMGLYNAIVDSVETTLPWAWDEIRTSINQIVDALRNILRNPLSSIQTIGKGVARVSVAVGAVLDAKDKIIEANIFAKDNRPYWFDFSSVFEDIYNDFGAIVRSLDDTIDWLQGEDGTDTGEAMVYAGVDLTVIKRQILHELWAHVSTELMAPFEILQRILDPFTATYELVTETIENIKDAWKTLVEAYNECRTLIESIFGPQFHPSFPRTFTLDRPCHDGFWRSTGQGHYAYPGIDLVIDIGADVVAPLGGEIRTSGTRQVTIKTDSVKDVEIIIDNVIPRELANNQVGAGDAIGEASTTWCNRGHLHVAMRNTETGEFIDPSRFKRKRQMPPPHWIEQCDHYELVWLGDTLAVGSLTRDPQVQNETVALENAPSPSDLETQGYTMSSGGRKKKSFQDWVDRFKNFTRSLGLGDLSNITQVFSTRLADMAVDRLLQFLNENGHTELAQHLDTALSTLNEFQGQASCRLPENMDDIEIQAALISRGQSIAGSRGDLERRLRNPDSTCYGLSSHVSEHTYCTFDDNCLGLSCCVEYSIFGVLRFQGVAFLKYNPCDQTIIVGFNEWTKVIPVPTIADFENSREATIVDINVGELNVIQLLLHYDISLVNGHFKINLDLAMCSSLQEQCKDLVSIANELEIPIISCQQASTSNSGPLERRRRSLSESLRVSQLMDFLDAVGLEEEEIQSIMENIREAFVEWVKQQVNDAIVRVFENVLGKSEMCMRGYQINFGPHQVTIYEQRPPIIFPLGWFQLVFRFGLNGYYGAYFHCNLCVLSMKARATIKPVIGAVAWGSVGIEIGPFRIQLRLDGYLLTTEFPTQAEVEFNKFPLDVKGAMDLKLTPLRVTLYGEIIFEISISLPWGGRIRIRTTLFRAKIWEYSSSTINKRIFGSDEIEQDTSPPEFLPFGNPPFEDDDNDGISLIEKRETSSSRLGCTVFQIADKDNTEPAFNIQYDAADDKSELEVTLCVGTYAGGCNVLSNEPLSGTSSMQSEQLYSGVPLYFTITARNSQGDGSSVSCSIATYDVTLPNGRVTPEFRSSSNPNILRCSIFVNDDSVITTQQVSAGFGAAQFGSQIVSWERFTTEEQQNMRNTNMEGDQSLKYFAVAKAGRLVYHPFQIGTFRQVGDCARECLAHPQSKCLSFNFDFGRSGACELMNSVEGISKVQNSGNFHFYERLGVGSTAHVDRSDLYFEHNSLIYCNAYIQNILGYEHFITSEGILYDHTPPDPGMYIVSESDELLFDDCRQFTPDYLEQRCVEQTSLPNYRFIIDVPYSECTLCNGHTLGTDMFWTRANRMVSSHWDHIHDDESGILVYTWAIGTNPCEDNIHPHHDPHAHIHKESEWTHQGVVFPLNLNDGIYHITLTALNEIEFGGPMALRICHKTPYIIDTTPPVIVFIDQAEYDIATHAITINATAEDQLSGIQYSQMGLGQTRRDTYILPYITVDDNDILHLVHQLPNGIPTWVKVRFANNVDLRETGHSPRALFIDESPPIPGTIYIGSSLGVHNRYQYDTTTLCANWEGFYDRESGIGIFHIAFGTTPWGQEVVPFTSIEHTEYNFCQNGLSLMHNTRYFATLIAFNGASNQKNVSSTSPPVLIDTTAPSLERVTDGIEDDISFSSSESSVGVCWHGAFDPESGLDDIQVTFMKQGTSQGIILHQQNNVPPSSTSLQFHHFRLNHGDYVFTEVSVTNGASMSTAVTTDGFLIDLTDPVMNYLGDGLTPHRDLHFSSSLVYVSANWEFVDDESSIASLRTAVFTVQSGMRQQIYPSGQDSWVTVNSTATDWNSGGVLTLRPGQFCYVRVKVVNGAGLTSVFDTDGVVIDSTPPEMVYVHAGVLAGESEENIDGYVFSNDLSGIRGSWRANDPESSISYYEVGIGTFPGLDDISSFTMLTDEDLYFGGLHLQLTNMTLDVPVRLYYISVTAVNGANQRSQQLVSSPIVVVEEDQDGVVWDGYGQSIADDIDFQIDQTTIAVSFSGFESALHGIERYEWAIGTRPRFDDIMAFTEYGIFVTDEAVRGLGSSGIAKTMRHLQHGQSYFSTIRAITAAGNVMDVSSDGITIDITTPDILFTALSSHEDIVGISNIYHRNMPLSGAWVSSDGESSVVETKVSIGTVPGGSDVYELFYSVQDELPLDTINPVQYGKPNFITVTVQNEVGLRSSVSSIPITIDNTEPNNGILDCPPILSHNRIKCSIFGFSDDESDIKYYDAAVGITEGDSSIVDFQWFNSGSNEFSLTLDNINTENGNMVFYVTVNVVNNARLLITAYSSPIYFDTTRPTGGIVYELSDYETYDVLQQQYWNPDHEPEQNIDIRCQRDTTRVHVKWTDFQDDETGIDYYDIALGSSPGSSQIQSYSSVPATANSYIFTHVNLIAMPVVFATVRAYNKAGLHTTRYSNGIYISRISAGLMPLGQQYVYDGTQDNDLDFQTHVDWLGANWNLAGDACPIREQSFSIMRFDETAMGPEQSIPPEQSTGYLDEISVRDRQSFYAVIKAKNYLNHTVILHSNGITIKLEPVVPGIVRDGIISGVDLSFQTSNSTIGCNWDGFGSNRNDGTFDRIIEGPDDIVTEVGDHQEIDHYEVAIGTDRTNHYRRTDIRPFTNVGLNTAWLFTDLALESETLTSIYYCTVRAFSISTAAAEVTSNGIRVGHQSRVIKHGEISLNSFISTTSTMILSWDQFQFSKPVLRYFWAIGAGNMTDEDYPCDEILGDWRTHLIGNVRSLQDVGTDTFVTPTDLLLTHNNVYTVFVLAVDEAGTCDLARKVFKADVTPPDTGTIHIENSVELSVLYTPLENEIHINWRDFIDMESNISSVSIALFRSTQCTLTLGDLYLQSPEGEVTVPGNITHYIFTDLVLQSETPYYVTIKVVNGAGLSVEVLSKPILYDGDQPTAGIVIDGLNIQNDQTFMSSTREISGTLLYLPANQEACSRREIINFLEHQHLPHIVHKGVLNFLHSWQTNVHFLRSQIRYFNDELVMSLTRKISESVMKSAAFTLSNDDLYKGMYEFHIQAANEDWAVTCITFWDGNQGVFVAPTNFSSESDDTGTARIRQSPLSEDTFPAGYLTSQVPGYGFGLKIRVDGTGKSVLTLWGSSSGEYQETEIIMMMDMSANIHNYKLLINDERDVTDMRDWDIKVLVDDVLQGSLGGINGVNSSGRMSIGLYNHEGSVPPLLDEFNPPTSHANVYFISLPPTSDISCHPFKGGSTPIVEFHVGIGSSSGLDDIYPFELQVTPSIPCGFTCADLFCDSHIDPHMVQEVQFTISNLNINPWSDNPLDTDNHSQLQQAYFFTVKALTGSGKASIASSNGFYIDTSPPIITSILHFDTDYSNQEPIQFQGNNHTIRVVWNSEDQSSGIADNQWAIGSYPNLTDIQDFVSIGLDQFAFNVDLADRLQNNHTYYVTIKAVNKAGLVTFNSSEGVTVLLDDPVVIDTPVQMPGTTRIGSQDTNAVVSPSQSNFTVEFETPPEDQNIEEIRVSAGTAQGRDDIFPTQQVGYNSSNQVSISNAGLRIGDGEYEPLDASRGQNDPAINNNLVRRSPTDQLLIDPGRAVHINIEACNAAHRCAPIPSKDIIVSRDTDHVVATDDVGAIEVQLLAIDSPTVINISAQNQTNATYLIAGTLSHDDVAADYKSEASFNFHRMIVDPLATMSQTSRALFGRVFDIAPTGFFATAVPMQPIAGPIKITFTFDRNQYLTANQTSVPTLLSYCPEQQLWVDAAESCTTIETAHSVDWREQRVDIYVCNLERFCERSTEGRRFRRQADSEETVDDYSGSHSFAVASVSTEYINHAPVLTSESSYVMDEDSGIMVIPLTAEDPEYDEFEFHLNTSVESRGIRSLSSDGALSYHPCEDCFGVELISITVREVRNDQIPVEENTFFINITVLHVNDSPRLIAVKEGYSLSQVTGEVIIAAEEYLPNKLSYSPLRILFTGYDVDHDGVNIYYGTVDNGDILIRNQIETDSFIMQNCSNDEIIRATWKNFEEELNEERSEITMMVPCQMDEDVSLKSVQWTLSYAEYTPKEGFYGQDHIQINARDRSATASEPLYVTFYVLANPCISGECVGPDYDPECTSLDRAAGFDGYSCQCNPGYKGTYCEIEIDECQSDPCPHGYKCIDKVDEYECKCSSGSCLLEAWAKALIAITIIAIGAIAIIVFVFYILLKRKRDKPEEKKLVANDSDEEVNENAAFSDSFDDYGALSVPPISTRLNQEQLKNHRSLKPETQYQLPKQPRMESKQSEGTSGEEIGLKDFMNQTQKRQRKCTVSLPLSEGGREGRQQLITLTEPAGNAKGGREGRQQLITLTEPAGNANGGREGRQQLITLTKPAGNAKDYISPASFPSMKAPTLKKLDDDFHVQPATLPTTGVNAKESEQVTRKVTNRQVPKKKSTKTKRKTKSSSAATDDRKPSAPTNEVPNEAENEPDSSCDHQEEEDFDEHAMARKYVCDEKEDVVADLGERYGEGNDTRPKSAVSTTRLDLNILADIIE